MNHNRAGIMPSAGRGQFVAGVLLGLSLGFATGHVFVFGRPAGSESAGDLASATPEWELLESVPVEVDPYDLTTDVEFSLLEVNLDGQPGRASLTDGPTENGLHFFPDAMDAAPGDRLITEDHNLAFASDSRSDSSFRMTADVTSDRDFAPQALEPAPSAAPIDPRTSEQEGVARRLIQEELPNATEQERDVWFEVLLGLPAEDIRGILRMRKRLGSGSSVALGGENSLTSPQMPVRPDLPGPSAAAPTSRPATDMSQRDRTMATLRMLNELDCQNLLNQQTIAYKQLLPNLAESLDNEVANDREVAPLSGIQLVDVMRDMTAGALRETGRPLDVAIDPEATRWAFFQVRRGDQVRYTRAGRLSLDEKGCLKLLTVADTWLLDPPIRLPGDTADVHIDTDGRVQVTTIDGTETPDVGQIAAVLFFNAAELRQAGSGLYEATATSGRPMTMSFGTAEAGNLIQRCVELSNVDELAARNRLTWQQSMMDLLGK